jgi:hypothetical protein
VDTAARAELVQFHPVRIIAPVLFGMVRTLPALSALQIDKRPRIATFLSHGLFSDLRDHTSTYGSATFTDGETHPFL